MESNTYFERCIIMRNNGWIKGIALVTILIGLFAGRICGEEVIAKTPSDQEIIEVFVFYEYGSEATFEVFEEYSSDKHIFYEAYDHDGTSLGSGFLNREDLINELF